MPQTVKRAKSAIEIQKRLALARKQQMHTWRRQMQRLGPKNRSLQTKMLLLLLRRGHHLNHPRQNKMLLAVQSVQKTLREVKTCEYYPATTLSTQRV
jgi:hypothetical protein